MNEQRAFQSLPYMKSYAQNLEDVMLRRALQDRTEGFYVDLGAYRPEADSVTKWFYDNGWSGVNVEPTPALHAEFVTARVRDVNLQLAVGGTKRKASFHIEEGSGLSHIVGEQSADAQAIVVEVVTLDELLEHYTRGKQIDFLKIDVEGAEQEILAATTLPNRPRIILVEATAPNSQVGVWQGWEPHLLRLGYEFVWFDGLNRFYLEAEERWRKKHFEMPPNVFDNFETVALGFGNVETVDGKSARELAEMLIGMRERAEEAERQLEMIRHSLVWRVTQPLRAARRSLRARPKP
jgi:FkbM family methyltransferase